MKKTVFVLLSVILLVQAPARAHEWKLDPVHSGILFDIKHIYSTVRGNFTDFTGDVFFDPENLEKSKFDFVVKADSINTNNGKRDNHLRSDDFFSAKKFPEMRFQSSKVSHAGGNKYTLEGKMTIKNVSKVMVLEFVYWGEKENPFDKNQIVAGFDSGFKIDRLEYHVGDGKFYNMGVVGKDVDILITLEVIREK